MRVYEFRGWSKSRKKWYSGGIRESSAGTFIDTGAGLVHVVPGTVSQWTWFEDKRGKKIYEYDYLKDHNGHVYVVEWNEDTGAYEINSMTDKRRNCDFRTHCGAQFEVVGNIFDNPELLEPCNN